MHCLILNRLRGKILATQYPHRFTLELFFCSMNIQQWQNLEKKNTHLFNVLNQDDELGAVLVNFEFCPYSTLFGTVKLRQRIRFFIQVYSKTSLNKEKISCIQI